MRREVICNAINNFKSASFDNSKLILTNIFKLMSKHTSMGYNADVNICPLFSVGDAQESCFRFALYSNLAQSTQSLLNLSLT